MNLSGVNELATAVLMLKNSNQDVAKRNDGDKSGYVH
jgi:hypothetical protein